MVKDSLAFYGILRIHHVVNMSQLLVQNVIYIYIYEVDTCTF